jgi:formylglycine-generating enzyme required for sulfatase activity
MPKLFISYKRGISAGTVRAVQKRLEQEGYWCWFDREDIRMSSTDWQASIEQGIRGSVAVILFFSQEASESPYIKDEIAIAHKLRRPIYALQVAPISDFDTALKTIGLPSRQQVENFTDVTRIDEQINRLIAELEKDGIRVTRHERRKQRDTHNPSYTLHQRYLSHLVERIGNINLAQISHSDNSQVYLEDVYVDSPIGLFISVNVQDWHVHDWWVSSKPKDKTLEIPKILKLSKPKPEEKGLDSESLLPIVADIDRQIAHYRRANPDKKPGDISTLVNKWKNGEKYNVVELHLADIANACSRLVVLGKPGSGKSTFVRYLALCLAGSQLDNWTRHAKLEQLAGWVHRDLTPIYIELRHFVNSPYFPPDESEQPTAQHLWNYIQKELLVGELAEYAHDLKQDLIDGLAVLILDGLDEVPYREGKLAQRQKQIINLTRSIHSQFGKSRVIVASRPHKYGGWKLPDFHEFEIVDFADEHRQLLTKRLLRLYQLEDSSEEVVKQKALMINQQIAEKAIDSELIDRPLFITMMVAIAIKNGGDTLPERRGALYRQSINLLLDRWTQSKIGVKSLLELLGEPTVENLEKRLMALAFDVHDHSPEAGTPYIDYEKIHKYLKPLGKHVAVDVISYLSENAGVLVSQEQDMERNVFQFAHRTFQEYLAGAELIERCKDDFGLISKKIETQPNLWQLPCMLAADVLVDRGWAGSLWALLDRLDDDLPDNMGKNDPRWHNIWLSARIIQEQKLYEQSKLTHGQVTIRQGLVQWLVKLVETGALNPVERAECGRVLALLGDTRRGVGIQEYERKESQPTTFGAVSPAPKPEQKMPSDPSRLLTEDKTDYGMQKYLDEEALSAIAANKQKRQAQKDTTKIALPDIDWAMISPSHFVMGSKSEPHNLPRVVQVPYLYYVSRYPITYAQFQTFLDAPDGFNDSRWWQDIGGNQRHPMREQAFRYANHPRESVSWYQAVAFCRWLDAKYQEYGLGLQDGKWQIRLPTEIEWEKVARGKTNWDYPWGDGLTRERGNSFETNVGMTTAVGSFPDGSAHHWDKPVDDLAGNVREWCLNKYGEMPSIDVDTSDDERTVRGGAWLGLTIYMRSTAQLYERPNYEDNDLGFRVVYVHIGD